MNVSPSNTYSKYTISHTQGRLMQPSILSSYLFSSGRGRTNGEREKNTKCYHTRGGGHIHTFVLSELRRRDGETERWGDGETERRRDKETER